MITSRSNIPINRIVKKLRFLRSGDLPRYTHKARAA